MAAATYDFTDKTQAYAAVAPETTREDNRITVFRNVVDFAEQNLATTQSATMLDIPANTLVLNVGFRVITADKSANFAIQDSTTANLWVTEAAHLTNTVNAIKMGNSLNATFYTSDDEVRLLCGGAGLDTLKLEVFAYGIELALDDKVGKPMSN